MAALKDAQRAAQNAGPGSVDVTLPDAVTNPDVLSAPASVQGGVNGARGTTNPKGGIRGGDQPASPEEQEEYDQAISALHKVMYSNEGTSQALVDMLQPSDKVGSTTKASILLIQQLDEKLDMDESIIAEITMDVADRMIEMAERAKGMSFSEKETQAVAGATWEGVMELFGVDEGDYEEMTRGLSEQDIAAQTKTYKGFLGD